MIHTGRTVRGLRALGLGRLLSQIFTWTVTLMVIRLLRPEDYGLMAMAMIFVEVAVLFNDLGIAAALIQQRRLRTQLVRQAFGLLLIINLLVCTVLVLIAPVAAAFFKAPELTQVLRVLALQFPLVTLGIIPDTMLRRRLRYARKAAVELLAAVVAGSITLALAWQGHGVWALVVGATSMVAIRSLGYTLVARFYVRPSFQFRGAGRMASFGRDATIGSLFWITYLQSDLFVLGRIAGQVVLGVYAIALQVAALPVDKIMAIINDVGLSALSRLQEDMPRFRRQYLRATRLAAYFAFPVLWGISAVAPELVSVVLGDTWLPSIPVLVLMGLAMPTRLLSGLLPTGLMALGQTQRALWVRAIPAFVLPGAFVAGAQWGALGVATIWAGVFPLLYLLNLRITLAAMGLKLSAVLSTLLKPLFAALLMWLSVYSLRGGLATLGVEQFLSLPLLVVTGAAVFCATTLAIDRDIVPEFKRLARR